MSKNNFVLFFVLFVFFAKCHAQGSGTDGKLRVCVVEGRGAYKRAGKFCPALDEDTSSGLECVIAVDRMDCLRRMHKGTVDFGVFDPEDLIAAEWANLDVLVTNELKKRSQPFESSIVAVVNRRILKRVQPDGATVSIRGLLSNTTFCHPGLGGEDSRGLSDTLSDYLLQQVTDRLCEANLSLTENRLKSMSQYFLRACKPGAWVPHPERDVELKSTYPNLCAVCRSTCDKTSRYWGDAGALSCLEDIGDFTWARVATVQGYFGVLKESPSALADGFAYLCPDGSWQPLNNNHEPCVWINRPWPVVVAKRKVSATVSELAWPPPLAGLLEATGVVGGLAAEGGRLPPLLPPRAPRDYLAGARGFIDAYSRTGCIPTRHITLCTTSPIESNKCSWLGESGAVYGISPEVQCSRKSSLEMCFQSIEKGESDAVVANSDWLVSAQRDYNVSPVLHELTPVVEQTKTVVAYVRNDSEITSMEGLRGKRAAFPRFDGFSWHAVALHLAQDKHRCTNVLAGYFSEICAPGIEKTDVSQEIKDKLTRNCYKSGDDILSGERQALRALLEGNVDVAFISMKTFKEYAGNKLLSWSKGMENIVPLEIKNNTFGFVSWSSLGHVYAANNITSMRRHEIINVFTKLDQLFGKHYPFHTAMFSMYGIFNKEQDVLFQYNTRVLSTESILRTHPYDKIPMSFDRALANFTFDSCNAREYLRSDAAISHVPVFLLFCVILVSLVV